MFCKNCGKTFDENARFCTVCGTPLGQVIPAPVEQPAPTVTVTPTPVEPPARPKSIGSVNAFGVILLVLSSICMIWSRNITPLFPACVALGILSVVRGFNASRAWYSGRYDAALSAAKASEIFRLIGWILFAVAVTVELTALIALLATNGWESIFGDVLPELF